MKICILTAGKGSRIGDLCKNINKALLPIDHKAILSKIIEKFDKNDTFVIGLGYKSEQIKKYLKIAHPDRKIIFVNIKNHDGAGSGPGLSLLNCKKYLNEPFVFMPCDCNFLDEFKNEPDKNWIGISKVPINESDQYCNVLVKKGIVTNIIDKEKSPRQYYAFTGLTYIKDHKIFWKGLKKEVLIKNEHQVSNGLKVIMKKSSLHVKKIKWQDMGTLKQFQEIQKQSNLLSIEKSNEFIYFINNKVIKFFTKEKIVDNKILKAKMKPLFFPNTKKLEKNFYYYDYWKGDIFYNSGNLDLFKKLLILLEKKFWISKKVNKNKMKKICKIFYQDKTIDRINLFLDLNPQYILPKTVNGEKIFSLKHILKEIPWDSLNNGTACFMHGDLNFSNILYDKKSDKFMLIDWRQDFAGEIDFGDIYYDLAKLYAGITMNFNHIIKGQYRYIEKNGDLKISFKTWNQSNKYKKILEEFIVERGFDLKKVKLLSGLTYLNMAALHPEPINKILITFGSLVISKELDK